MYRGLELIVSGLNLTNEVFGFYNGSTTNVLQREYYKPTYSFRTPVQLVERAEVGVGPRFPELGDLTGEDVKQVPPLRSCFASRSNYCGRDDRLPAD